MKASDRIRELADKKAISMYSLSQETGISQSTLSRFLSGKGDISRRNLKILSDYFRVGLDWLITGEGAPYLDSTTERAKLSARTRIIQYISSKGISVKDFAKEIRSAAENWEDMTNDYTLPINAIEKALKKLPELNPIWVFTGEGSMLKKESTPAPQVPERKRIPLYDDVSTIGGLNDNIANTSDTPSPSEWIDAGDWFPEATAAIRHYGDSMVEYPSGSILALKRVNDRRLILNGRNYVIETTEFRVTKQLQYDGGDFIMAYSSNRETYPDGRLIHAPIKIPTDTVRHIDLVLGCVTKEYSNGAIAIKK